jgi:hypothetical protein
MNTTGRGGGVKGKSGGHNRKSVQELQLTGTYREDRHGQILVPEKDRERVLPQDHITSNNLNINKVEIFDYFADVLHEQGMTQAVDSIILSQLVEAQVMYLTAIHFATRDLEAVIGKKLAYNVAMEAAKEVRTIMGEFRLLPLSRTLNVANDKQADADPVQAFLDLKSVN